MRASPRGEVWAALAATSFAAFELTQRYAAPSVDPTVGALIRTLPLVAGAWVYLAARRDEKWLHALRRWDVLLALVAIGAFDFVIGNTLKLLAFKTGGISLALPILEAGNLLGAAALAAFLVGQALTRRLTLGLGIMVLGGVALSLGSRVLPLWGVAVPASLGAGLSFASSVALTAYVFSLGVGVAPMLAVSSTAGLILLSAIIIPSGSAALSRVGTGDFFALLSSGILSGLAILFLARAVRTIDVGRANAIAATNSAAAAALGTVIFGEQPGLVGWLGIAAVFAGAFVARSSIGATDQEGGEEPAPEKA